MSQLNGSNRQREVKERSVFIRVLHPLIMLAILNAIILLLVLYLTKVPYQLNKNSYEICQKQVDNRQRYLQSQMTEKWMELDELVHSINLTTESMILSGQISLDELDSNTSVCTPLVLNVIDRMIQVIYSSQVSGMYLVFNTHDLEADIQANNWRDKTGVFIRDKDPMSVSSEKYADLLLECSPAKVVQKLSMSTDRNWEQRFKFSQEKPYEDWLVKPYHTAVASGTWDASYCGLWSIRQETDGKGALTYSIPMILSDGTVYGVLGIDLLSTYLDKLLPYDELDEEGLYGLFISEESPEEDDISGVVYTVSGSQSFPLQEEVTLEKADFDDYQIMKNGVLYEAAISPLAVYSRNTPFENQKWYIIGMVPRNNLFAFSERVNVILIISCLVILIVGIVGAMIASRHIARPILNLKKELTATRSSSIPNLSKTGVREVDDFAVAITELSQKVVNSSKRFLSIMEMSSIEMGGYELDEQNNFLFVTDKFFHLFNHPDLDLKNMTPKEFLFAFEQIKAQSEIEQSAKDNILYSTRDDSGTVRYIHVQERQIESRRIGVVEDVTLQTLEKKHIERERDYDLLTGIYNRRAFTNDTQILLEQPEILQTAIAVMIDLDDLKKINDAYGHEWGDRYIVAAAKCIQKFSPAKSVFSRVSGDEFNILMYGFQDEDEAVNALNLLWNGFHETVFQLPDGIIKHVSASGGYALIKEDDRDIQLRIKFADFAMYRVKKEKKGWFGKFDVEQYLANEAEKEKHSAFRHIVRKERIRYVFQPIISGKTGKMYGCEALMRVMENERMNLEEFFRIARQENALSDVEHLTWFNALPAFRRLIQSGIVGPDTKLFINSQVSHLLGPDEQKELTEMYADLRDQVVMEVVETDDLTLDFSNMINRQDLFAKEFALDDYGTGYNSEKNLISLMPGFIKVDMSLIRGVEKYQERQKLISGLISFAHEKDMVVLAEGVETMAELYCLLTLGVDMFQGFLFAHPSEIPGDLNPEAMDLIQAFMK